MLLVPIPNSAIFLPAPLPNNSSSSFPLSPLAAINLPFSIPKAKGSSITPIPQESWGYTEDLEQYKPEYNPEEAKEILSETEYADGFDTEIYVGESRVPIATIFQNQMKENLNIDVEIKVVEWGTLSDTVSKNNAPMADGHGIHIHTSS